MGGKTVPERVAGDPLGYSRAGRGRFDCLLDRGLIHVVPLDFARARVARPRARPGSLRKVGSTPPDTRKRRALNGWF